MFWPAEPSPWEVVVAFFFPDLSRSGEFRMQPGFLGLSTCRGWAYLQATRADDPMFEHSGYSCGVRPGGLGAGGRLRPYRLRLE
jgi:hypothetical protein